MAVHEHLKLYLDAAATRPFSWRDHNCMSFVMGYLDLPELPLDWFLGHDTPHACFVAYIRKVRATGYAGLTDAFDDLLQREHTLHPRSGFVVARPAPGAFGHIYGLHWMGGNVFLTEHDGLAAVDPEHADVYWSVP